MTLDSNKQKSTYVLFTGLPGSGKSSTLHALMHVMKENKKKAIYRDIEVKKYKAWYFYFAMYRYIPLGLLLRIFYFWATYMPPENSKYGMFEYRFWKKKLALFKRVISGLVLINKEKPDYFIDESIEVEYRIFDFSNKTSDYPWKFYAKTKNYLIVMDTDSELSLNRAVKRETSAAADTNSIEKEWATKESWLKDMYANVIKLSEYLRSNPEIDFQVKILDGTNSVESNVDSLRKYLMVDK